jgi:hypothetical protein
MHHTPRSTTNRHNTPHGTPRAQATSWDPDPDVPYIEVTVLKSNRMVGLKVAPFTGPPSCHASMHHRCTPACSALRASLLFGARIQCCHPLHHGGATLPVRGCTISFCVAAAPPQTHARTHAHRIVNDVRGVHTRALFACVPSLPTEPPHRPAQTHASHRSL